MKKSFKLKFQYKLLIVVLTLLSSYHVRNIIASPDNKKPLITDVEISKSLDFIEIQATISDNSNISFTQIIADNQNFSMNIIDDQPRKFRYSVSIPNKEYTTLYIITSDGINESKYIIK